MQKWSQRSSLKEKSKEGSQFAKNFWRGKMTFWAVSSQVYQYDPETKRQSAQWKTPIPHEQKSSSVQIKSQNIVADFFYIRGIVHYEFVPTGQTVNQVYYLEVLKSCVKKVDGNDPNFLLTTHGSCITRMHLLTRHCL